MVKYIKKVKIAIGDADVTESVQCVHLLGGAHILSIKIEDNIPYLYFMTDPAYPSQKCIVSIYSTDFKIEKNDVGIYLDTIYVNHLARHIFYKVID